MKRKHKRLLFTVITFIMFGMSVVIVLNKLRNNISFFFTPTEILSRTVCTNCTIRIGGMVINGSVEKYDSFISFCITDLENQIKVLYQGILPPLFSEGSWIVAKGKIVNDEFVADEILAKHDENYKPGKYKTK